MNVADFDFELPDELIAQEPSSQRGESRLLVLNRTSGELHDTVFTDIGNYLKRSDLLVLNNTRVFPARLRGRRVPSGGDVECLLTKQIPNSKSQIAGSNLQIPGSKTEIPSSTSQIPGSTSQMPTSDGGFPASDPRLACNRNWPGSPELAAGTCEDWEALMHPGQKLKPGARVVFAGEGGRLYGEVLARHFFGRRTIRLWTTDGSTVRNAIDRLGHIPLPPYIKRDDTPADRDRYQTVYASRRGSVAAPTAGLHFTAALLEDLAARGVERLEITLHVGYGTFKPVRTETVEDHVVDAEVMTVTAEAAEILTAALRDRRRIIAVGTTTARALESLSIDDGHVRPVSGMTDVFIKPGHEFRIVQGLITNFHLPRSSLLMLVAAFGGRDRVLDAYRHAVAREYRFYSYGDAMLIV